ncbi:amidase domain-containing protein [Heyndrickxia acidiproducens]|uniref:amidase domain-containing protein n=1 Tax=Heyndrickxia acidiproducens TaxID=1121084 RepID=UPI000363FA70|nr:amidase domain-containing protein [Heyndrickxia acidiproducens]
MKEQIQAHLEKRLTHFVGRGSSRAFTDIDQKIKAFAKRDAEIVKAKADAKVLTKEEKGDHCLIGYQVHMQYLVKQKHFLYMEEEVEKRQASFYKGELCGDEAVTAAYPLFRGQLEEHPAPAEAEGSGLRIAYTYDRLKAVQYAERWWNSFNPAYKSFTDDCTNYISQCLHAGGAPMRGYPDRSKGWWMRNNNWSYSWTVAHSLKTYLQYSKTGLRAKEVSTPQELKYGDIICVDFQGDGRFDHTLIVTGYDYNGMPLVNAHTTNSRKRYWTYEDSSAYTPDIRYMFFTIVDDS